MTNTDVRFLLPCRVKVKKQINLLKGDFDMWKERREHAFILAIVIFMSGFCVAYKAQEHRYTNRPEINIEPKTVTVEKTVEVPVEVPIQDEFLKIMEPDEITGDFLRNRNGLIVVEKTVGKCLDENWNGKILNTESEYNYISYSGVSGILPGDTVVTYEVYNPSNNYEDDIVARWDFVVEREG